jgi:hypothetical protein
MMKEEFEKLTGLQVGPEVYHLMECVYMNSPQLDKQAFCEQYKGNIGFSNLLNLVEQELVELQRRVEETDAVMSQELVSKDTQIKSLEEKLDKELEWKLAESTGTNLSQEEYEKVEMIITEASPKFDAVKFVADEWRFQEEYIRIIKTVHTYEKNRHGMLRVKDTYEREPFYVSTDWNYVRFDVNDMQYEVVNGELYFYYD